MKVSQFSYRFVKNQSQEDTCDVFIDGDIVDAGTQEWLQYWGDNSSTSYKSLRDQILNSGCNNINIHINSGGGMVADALAMGDFIKEQISAGKNINTYGKGIIASAATYPLMAAGKNSHISKNAFFMIHNVSGGAYGTVDEIEATAKMMRKFNDCVRDEYADMTGKPKETISAWMNAETWFTGKETCDNGFVRNCTAMDTAITNKITKDNWLFNDKAIRNTINNSIPKNKDMKKNKLVNAITEAFKNLGLSNDATLSTVKVSNLKDMLIETLSAQEEDEDVTEAITNALTGDAFETAVSNTVKKILDAAVPEKLTNAINEAVTNGTKELVNKEQLTKLQNDIADKLGTQRVKNTKPKNGAAPTEPEDDDDSVDITNDTDNGRRIVRFD
jgi:ATP-dependent Clp protease, protease subunit